MITTAVQAASQMVEIQGAPPAAASLDDAFRVTFAASVDDAKASIVGAKPNALIVSTGASSSKQVLTPELLAKNLSDTIADAKQVVTRSNHSVLAVALGSATAKATAAVSSTTSGIASSAPTVDLSTESAGELTTIAAGTLPKQEAQADHLDPEKSAVVERVFDSGAKNPAQPVVASAPLVPAASSKPAESSKAEGPGKDVGSRVVHDGRGDVSVSDVQIAAVSAQPTTPNVIPGSTDSAPAHVPVPSPVRSAVKSFAFSNVQPAGAREINIRAVAPTERAIDVAPSADATKQFETTAAASSAGLAKGGTATATPANELVSVQKSGEGIPKASELLKTTEDSEKDGADTLTMNVAGVSPESSVSASREYKDGAPLHQETNTGASVAVSPKKAGASEGTVAPVVVDGTSKQLVSGARAQSRTPSTVVDNSVQAGSAGVRPQAAAVTQTRSISKQQVERSGSSRVALAPENSKATSSVPQSASDQNVNGLGISSAADAKSGVPHADASTSSSSEKLQAPSQEVVRAAASSSEQPSQAQDARPSGLSSVAPHVAVVSDVKDEKTKLAVDGASPGSDEIQSTVGGSPIASFSSGFTSNVSSSPNTLAAVLPAGAGVGIPIAHATAVETAAPPSHLVATAAAPQSVGHIVSGGAGSSLSEPSAAASQIGDSHRTLLATPTALEVGVQSGTQGWLRIRAEVGGQGEVNTSLTAASNGGRELLHSQMPALNAFLHSEQIAATATVVDRVPATAGGLQGGTTTGSGVDSQGSSGSLLQGGGAQNDRSQRDAPQSLSVNQMARSYDARGGVSEEPEVPSGRTTVSEESGRWLNVRV